MALSSSIRNGLRNISGQRVGPSVRVLGSFFGQQKSVNTNVIHTKSSMSSFAALSCGNLLLQNRLPTKMMYSTEKESKEEKKIDENQEENDQEVKGQNEEAEKVPAEENESEVPEEEEQPSKIKQLEVEIEDMKKKLLLAYAEMENVRSIARRDVDNAKTYAVQGFAKNLLDVADNLSRAIESVPEEAKDADKYPHLMSLLEGIEMTDVQLTKVFNSNNLIKYGEVGEPFDPAVHDAMFEYEDESKTPGTIGQLLKCGYKLHDRVIRPAQVGTIKASSK
mmetsp:Transcript_33116/g.42318  ORF Transcript_33116/g.42318 Transcript_33116/m.42318 type:complete len:279 (+) Transcript_33116:184-1020(+)